MMHRYLISSLILIALLMASIGGSRVVNAESALEMEIQSSHLPSSADWYFENGQKGALLGYSVHTAGDVNNDGFADVIVGSPVYSPTEPDSTDPEGAAFAFYGGSGGLQTLPDWLVGNGSKGSRFGAAVSGAGDVNGDGYDDVIVGAEEHKLVFEGIPGEPKSGAAFLYLGSENGLAETPSWTQFAEAEKILFGFAVAAAGDVNNDGYDDVLIGAKNFESSAAQSNEGKVYLFFGSENGLAAEPDWTYECNLPESSCGYALSSAGDINNDGFDDIIVGAPYYDNPETNEGAALIFLGSETGPRATANFILESNQSDAWFGISVASAGDVNNDGFADVMIGASNFDQDEAHPNVGAAFLYLGSPTGPSLNFDWVSYGSEEYSKFGNSVRSAGDINRDGYADVLVGAYLFGENGEDKPDEGAVFLYKGKASGLHADFAWSGFGNKAEAEFGFSAGTAGDINGDGGIDIIVGAPKYKSDEKTVMGRAFVFLNTLSSDPSFQTFIPLVNKNK